MRTSTRFNLQFLRLFKKKDTAESFILIFFSPQKLVRLFILKEVKPSLDRKMIKFTHLVTCSRHYDILAKSRCRMTTAITFSRCPVLGGRYNALGFTCSLFEQEKNNKTERNLRPLAGTCEIH